MIIPCSPSSPPYNNIHAQVIDPHGKLVKSASALQVTYHAVADPDGLINRTCAGKTNFWQFVEPLFGVRLAEDMGLAGQAMPGAQNTPQPMRFDSQRLEWVAEGVPILSYPDNPPTPGAKHYYPLMRIAARDSKGRVLASADIVLPVSDEMACSGCHSSDTIDSRAMPSRLANNPSPDRDYKLNILQLHDDRRHTNLMASQPVLCAKCHPSNALGTTGGGKAAHAGDSCQTRGSGGDRSGGDAHGLLPLPSGFGDPVSARRDGQRRHAVSELSRQHGPGGRRRQERLARRAIL
ncbi:MAG: hypothetical protein ACP5UT_05615 [Bryobacteraceae bacterium]